MRPHPLLLVLFLLLSPQVKSAEPEFPLTADSKPQPDVPKGELIKDTYTADGKSCFPGTQREYQLYIPQGLDRSKPAAFMVFQDGVIYQAPVVFDNLIAKKDIPPLIGVFIKPGVIPAADGNALPRFNRSFEYDSITDTYSRFLIEEFLPAIETKHGIKLSADPNDAAISGNSSGGIAAFMVAWHRPDRFRRVFTGVGTYVGIHGGDRLPVLVRKFEPKPIRIFLQSGTGDNNLYCGDWWMANQMMERSFTWAGYDVNHAWSEGGHNQKHASQIFPDVLRWLWRDWQTTREIKANARGESKWKGYEVCQAEKGWDVAARMDDVVSFKVMQRGPKHQLWSWEHLASDKAGVVYVVENDTGTIVSIPANGPAKIFASGLEGITSIVPCNQEGIIASIQNRDTSPPQHTLVSLDGEGKVTRTVTGARNGSLCASFNGRVYAACYSNIAGESPVGDIRDVGNTLPSIVSIAPDGAMTRRTKYADLPFSAGRLAFSPDQTLLYACDWQQPEVISWQVQPDGSLKHGQRFVKLDTEEGPVNYPRGICVDTDGRVYVATTLGIQVCDQAGRVNFIIPTPEKPFDVSFGGKDLSELFIACGKTVYRRAMKVHGIASGQMAPIKPAPPKL
ncbi:sugar lactone lactonase YvrE [Roseimicrobium gellanilyticum]|uniref:Sugar lactone lactonase YvrE n=1 Tax=Roseimicrobium gellanilyticum TaxID=748857 RepID=A0A366H5H3_9BACT|nr:SMP-30/gluconolactonase/LRE family protein [Roseimicrobium gellanilyticum]RBP37317.1 sugar lactone lactonase YvrE [Roseimicrobium gellanilyticum]